jgi:hypothetical protein
MAENTPCRIIRRRSAVTIRFLGRSTAVRTRAIPGLPIVAGSYLIDYEAAGPSSYKLSATFKLASGMDAL